MRADEEAGVVVVEGVEVVVAGGEEDAARRRRSRAAREVVDLGQSPGLRLEARALEADQRHAGVLRAGAEMRVANGWVASTMASMPLRCDVAPRPSGRRSAVGACARERGRDLVARACSASASSRASVVPPRISTRMAGCEGCT